MNVHHSHSTSHLAAAQQLKWPTTLNERRSASVDAHSPQLLKQGRQSEAGTFFLILDIHSWIRSGKASKLFGRYKEHKQGSKLTTQAWPSKFCDPTQAKSPTRHTIPIVLAGFEKFIILTNN